jgi:glyoxylase-like metal-dependent hydrolase (beta-lactamase superfamily II)
LAQGDPTRSAAHWYGLRLEALEPDRRIGDGHRIELEPGRVLEVVHTPGHTPGSVAAWCRCGEHKVLFGQDIHGPFSPSFGSDLAAWRSSMQRLLALEADILAEGHYGIFRPAAEVAAFIQSQLDMH